jgi:hypothetical protein
LSILDGPGNVLKWVQLILISLILFNGQNVYGSEVEWINIGNQPSKVARTLESEGNRRSRFCRCIPSFHADKSWTIVYFSRNRDVV